MTARELPPTSDARASYTTPVLREHGDFAALTQTRTCANGFNDGTSLGCFMSGKKS